MDIIENLPFSDQHMIMAELAAIVVCVIILVIHGRRKKRARQIAEVYIKKQREENLTDRIKNSDMKDAGLNFQPYEVSYREPVNGGANPELLNVRTSSIRLQLILTTEMATKKYLLDLEDEIKIGRRENSDIVVDDKRVSASHCVLINRAGDVFAADLNSSNGTVLQRHTGKVQLGTNPVKILDSDRLLLAGAVSLDIKIV